MKKKKAIIIFCVFVSALTLLSSFCGLWNSYMISYCEPIVLYPMENGTGFYEELPSYAPYYTQLGTYSYLTTGDDIDDLNAVCAGISDDYRKFYAYDVVNLFFAKLNDKNSVAYFADNNAVKYLNGYVTEGRNINPDGEKTEVLIGGKQNAKIRTGESITVSVNDAKGAAYSVNCVVVGRIDERVPLPADVNFTPDSYYTQQDSIIVFPQTVKYERGLQYENRFLVRIVNVEGVTRPDDYTFVNVTDYFTEKGYPSIAKTNREKMNVSSAYFSFALTRITLTSGSINPGQIYFILLIVLTIAVCVGIPIIILRKKSRISHVTTVIVFAAVIALCSLAFVIAKYGCGFGLLTYSGFISYPLLFSGITAVASTITKFAVLRKRRIEEIYTD